MTGTDPTTCLECPVGQSSGAGSTKCQPCEAGTYINITGQPSCKDCEAGLYRNSYSIVLTSCSSCDKGTYQNDTGQTSCLPCIPGEYNNAIAQTSVRTSHF